MSSAETDYQWDIRMYLSPAHWCSEFVLSTSPPRIQFMDDN